MRNGFAFAVSTLQNYSTKIILLVERIKFWFNFNRNKHVTLVNILATDSKSYFLLQIRKWMDISVRLKTFVLKTFTEK